MISPAVLTAVPTAFLPTEELNIPAFRALLMKLESAGVDGVFVAGTTGEFTALDDTERLQLISEALAVFGPERVIAHIGAPSGYQATRLAASAAALGATRLAAVTPFFQPAPPDQILRYYERILSASAGASLYAYLFRSRTTTITPPSLLPGLHSLGIVGAKISGESDDAVREYLEAAPSGFEVWSGNDRSMRWLHEQGGVGVVSGVSSAFPEPFLALRDAIRAGDGGAASRAERLAQRSIDAVRGGNVAHLKQALRARGLDVGDVRTATETVPPTDRDELLALSSSFSFDAAI